MRGRASLRAVAPALPALAALACGALFPPEVEAQEGGDLILGAGGGVTFTGLSMMSDPDFIGSRWGLQAEVRGRHVGRGDGIIEVSLAVAHRRF